MNVVKPKKMLGQHFLTDINIARKIVGSLSLQLPNLLEIGPGTGVLTQYLINDQNISFKAIEIDRDSVKYLKEYYPQHSEKIIEGDFIKADINEYFNGEPYAIIGNFPYNISSQIFFKVLAHRNSVTEIVCMIQKEVAERLAAPPGSKTYGILSVLLQAWFTIEYLFTVHENVFIPPPKVKSGVIKLTRNQVQVLGCDEALFFVVVKTSFNQRRKMLRNSIKSLVPKEGFTHPLLTQRPEQLSVAQFVELTNAVSNFKNS